MAKQKAHNIIVFDCETGGIDKKNGLSAINHPITQIALVSIDGFSLKEIARYSSFMKGKKEPMFESNNSEIVSNYVGYGLNQTYQYEAFDITGTTIEKLERLGQDIKIVVNQIIEFFEESKSGSSFHKFILGGHNVTYDIPFLQYAFKLCKKDLSKYVQGYYDAYGNFQPVFIDSQYLSRLKSTDEDDKHKLEIVANREGFDFSDAHDAMNDTLITAEILKKYILLLRSSGEGEVVSAGKFRDEFVFEFEY